MKPSSRLGLTAALPLALTLAATLAPGPAAAAPPTELHVQVLSATSRDKVVPNAQVIFQKEGQTSLSGTTDASGKAVVPNGFGVDDRSISLIVKADGYSPLVVSCPCDGMSYAVSETLGQQRLEAFRVVLNWGAQPSDLDLHVAYRGNHVYWQSKTGRDAFLDVDDTSSFGPETITINKRHDGEKYVFAVHNYSAQGSYGSTQLSDTSQAKVFVYAGESLIKSYYVPPHQVGGLWVLFALDENGALSDIDRVVDIAEIGRVGSYLTQMTERSDFGVPTRTAPSDQATARELTKQSDQALAAGKVDDAISLAQRACAADPNSAEAFAALAKAYGQVGRAAEKSWAERKIAELGRLSPALGWRVPNELLSLEASSFLADWKHYTFVPKNLLDDNLWSSWQPNRTKQGGVGEWFKVTFAAPQQLTGFEVFNGFRLIDDLGDLYKMNNRVKDATVELSDGTTMPLHFEDVPRGVVIPLPEAKTVTWFKVRVDSVYKGSRWNDLAISEFHPLSRSE